MKQDGVLLENLLTSTEIFDTETETWSDGPELPISLAFATVVSTPLATFIMGGQTVGGDPSSATGKSFSEALILASANPQYDKRLFIELQVQYMKIARSEHTQNMLRTYIVYINCSECQNKKDSRNSLTRSPLIT